MVMPRSRSSASKASRSTWQDRSVVAACRGLHRSERTLAGESRHPRNPDTQELGGRNNRPAHPISEPRGGLRPTGSRRPSCGQERQELQRDPLLLSADHASPNPFAANSFGSAIAAEPPSSPFDQVYSAPTCSPFSATDRFMSGTRTIKPNARTPKSQKTSK